MLTANYFFTENEVVQEYIVPGNKYSNPYEQIVKVKVWGAGGGGCDGGKQRAKSQR